MIRYPAVDTIAFFFVLLFCGVLFEEFKGVVVLITGHFGWWILTFMNDCSTDYGKQFNQHLMDGLPADVLTLVMSQIPCLYLYRRARSDGRPDSDRFGPSRAATRRVSGRMEQHLRRNLT